MSSVDETRPPGRTPHPAPAAISRRLSAVLGAESPVLVEPPAAIGERTGWSGLATLRAWIVAMPDVQRAILVAVFAAAVYFYTAPAQPSSFDYFIRLADAFLHGRIYLTEGASWLNELVPTSGGYFVVYPPMPAVLLMPFVAVFGPHLAQQTPNALFGGIAMGLLWLALGRFRLSLGRRALLTFVFAFGSVFWYTTAAASVWYVSHTVAVMFAVAALLPALDRRWPWLAGLLLGCAAISRLPVALTAPFYLAMLLGLGWPLRLPENRRRAVRTVIEFGVGMGIPVGLYLLYNLARWGTITDQGYVLIPGVLQDPIYSHGIFSIDYIPRQLYAMLLRSWNFDDSPPFLKPSWWGLSIFLTTPLILWVTRARWRDPRVLFAALGTALALIPIVTHGNVGISQFGYRFSLDFQPLLWVALATVFERRVSKLAIAAGLASIAINMYAVWAIGIGFVSY